MSSSENDAELVVRENEDGDAVSLDLWTGRGRGAAEAGAEMVGDALSQARAAEVRHVSAAVEASAPACGDVLSAMRRQFGGDVEQMDTRRAGASVMVDLVLAPGPSAAHE